MKLGEKGRTTQINLCNFFVLHPMQGNIERINKKTGKYMIKLPSKIEKCPNSSKLLPSKSYTYTYEQKQKLNTYLLYHEIMPDSFENTIMEPLIEMPTIKSVRAKFNKPTLLKFTCIEDDEGFIA